MGCMPYGQYSVDCQIYICFVSIPHMGCMPYGQYSVDCQIYICFVSIPHMGCMPYGRRNRTAVYHVF